MTLKEIAARLRLRHLTPELSADASPDVTDGHVSDLLSDVLAHAPRDGVLVTQHLHMNVIAVCVNAGLTAVIFAADREPEEPVRRKAVEEGVQLYASAASGFDIVGQLYALGLRGRAG